MTIIFEIKQMDLGQQIILQNNDLKMNFSIKSDFSLNPKKLKYFGKNFTIFYNQKNASETSFLLYYTIGPANLKTQTSTISTQNPIKVILLENLSPGFGSTICLSDSDINRSMFLNVDVYVSESYLNQFIIFASDGDNFDIYLQNLNNSKKNSDGVLSKISLPTILNKNCMTIYQDYGYDGDKYQGVVIFKYYDGYADCKTMAPTKSVVNLTNNYNSPCKYTILSPHYSAISFSNMTRKTNQTIKILSELNQKSLINLRASDDINLLQQLLFFTPVLSIIIPVNGFFSVSLGYYITNQIRQVVPGQKGILASPAYNAFYSSKSSNKTFAILSKIYATSFQNSIKFNADFYSNNEVLIENVSEKKIIPLVFFKI